MSFIFDQFVSQIYPAPTGEPKAKDLVCKAIKLTFSDFTTGGAVSQKAYIPADASIVSIRLWVKAQLSGGGITAAALNVGTPTTANKFVSGASVLSAAGTYTMLPVSNIFQVFDPTAPGGDVPIQITGTATTGNPTVGELYILIEYVR